MGGTAAAGGAAGAGGATGAEVIIFHEFRLTAYKLNDSHVLRFNNSKSESQLTMIERLIQ